jgi:hypothetical protein
MSCDLTSNYTYIGCKGGAGGIKEVLMTEFANVSSYTVTSNTHIITAITMDGSTKFRQYKLDKEMGFFTNAGTYTPASGSISYEPQIDFTIKTLTTALVTEITMISKNELVMIVRDAVDNYWLFGKERGMDLMTWNAESGTAFADFNGFKLSFKGKEIQPIYKVDSSIIAALIA